MATWSVNESEIVSLSKESKDKFNKLIFDLIVSEALTCGISSSKIICVEEEKKDGGVDLHIESNSEFKKSDWYVLPKSIWQIKTNSFRNIEDFIKFLKKELADKGKFVQKLAENGYKDYIIVWSHNPAGQSIKKIETELNAFFKTKKWVLKTHVLTANQIARWCENYQSLCERHFGRNIGNLQSFDSAYRNQVNSTIPFQANEEREVLLKYLKDNCQNVDSQKHIRIEGVTGVGKTRVVLEAIKETPIENFCLYASDPGQIPGDYLSSLERAVKKPSDIFLVIDECDDPTSQIYEGRLSNLGVPYLLITINRKSDRKLVDTAYDLPKNRRVYLLPLGEEMIETIVNLVVPNAPQDLVSAVVHLCGGFVKLAVLLAQEAVRRPFSNQVKELIEQPSAQNALNVIFENEEEKNLLRYLALFTELGWDEDLSVERDALTTWSGMDARTVQKFYDLCTVMQDRGLVVKRGRYRYVTPDLLAIWLAHDFYRSTDVNKILDLIKILPDSRSKRAFLERLADLGMYPETEPITEKLLDEFKNLKDIDSDETGQLLSLIIEANPEISKKKVTNLITNSNHRQLTEFKHGRQYLVWSLEKLAWLPESFEEALECLFQLASTEVNPSRDGATRTIKTLYQTVLSGTAVSLKVRLNILKKYLKHRNPSIRKIAILATTSLFNDYQTRASHGEHQRGRLVPPEYRPTNLEVSESLIAGLELLEKGTRDESDIVSLQAKKSIFDLGRNCAKYKMFDPYLNFISDIYTRDETTGREVRQSLEGVIAYEKEYLNERQFLKIRKLLNSINNKSFHSRLERWTGRPTHEDYILFHEKPEFVRSEREKLAKEIINDPSILDMELEWMVSTEAIDIWHILFPLGKLDSKRYLLPRILEISKKAGIGFLTSAYVSGWGSEEPAKAKEFLDNIIKDGLLPVQALFDCIWRNDYLDHDWVIEKSIYLVKDRGLNVASLGALRWASWLKNISLKQFKQIITICLEYPDSEEISGAAIALLMDRLKDRPEDKEALSELSLATITRTNALVSKNNMTDWEWNEIATQYKEKYPKQIVTAILKAHKEKEELLYKGNDAAKLLHEIVVEHQNCWELVGEYLLANNRFSMALRISLEGWFTNGLDNEMLLKWINNNGGTKASLIVADLSPVRISFKDSLIRELLIKFPKSKDLRSIIFGNFLSGGYSGPTSDHIKGQLADLQDWKNDSHLIVKKFAAQIESYLLKELSKEEIRDEEGLL